MEVVGHTFIFHFLEYWKLLRRVSKFGDLADDGRAGCPTLTSALANEWQLWQWEICRKPWPVVFLIGQGEAQRAEPIILL